MKKLLCILALVASLPYGCAMPTTTVRTIDDRPTIAIKGAPEGAMLFIDGLNMGLANQYAGENARSGQPTALTVEPGTHMVSITLNGATIYEQKVFVDSSLKTITVR
jgi:hypothetical protein